ncbi:hypothetical protein [Microbaculum marinum]|uniref:Uncharacterized protein n=1 Tax=Microbaculum marinum TaxID=1764581 RepID=A0AAW9RYL2_9HYPH
MRVPVLIAVAALLAACGGRDSENAVPIDTIVPVDVADLVGAKAADGETQLKERRYEVTRNDGATAYWWSGSRGSCLRVVMADGRYQSVEPVAPTQCSSTAGKKPVTSDAGEAPADLVSFVGANGGQSESALQNLGYEATRTVGLTSYWWNQATGVCARIVTADGRYRTINTVAESNCKA